MRRRATPADIESWRTIYEAKTEFLDSKFQQVTPEAFYRDLFRRDFLQSQSRDGKGNIIATQIRKGRDRSRQWIIGDDLSELPGLLPDPFLLIPPISYFGRTHRKAMAHDLFSVATDIDYVGIDHLYNLIHQFDTGLRPKPTYLISSGKGVHLYYHLTDPVALYRWRAKPLAQLKERLIRYLWNDTTSYMPDNPDITGIYQGFRAVGSLSKLGPNYPVRAWHLTTKRYSLTDIRDSIPLCDIDLSRKRPEGKHTLDTAKTLWPDWYDRRVVRGETESGKTWTTNPALYAWWKRRLMTDAQVGGRYYAIMALCSFGLKSGIPDETIRQDAYALIDHLDSLTIQQDNHFTRQDIDDALKSLSADRRHLAHIASRKWIEQRTKMSIPPNKRNGRKQATHLRIARTTLAILNDERADKGLKPLQGRPTKQEQVQAWRRANPTKSKTDCQRATGISLPTIRKWWPATDDTANQPAPILSSHPETSDNR